MTLPRPYILFPVPLKIKPSDHDDAEKILGLWQYGETVLVIHDLGYINIRLCRAEAVERVEEEIKKL